MTVSRREFLGHAAAVAAACMVPLRVSRAPRLRFGYASITWGGDDLKAIDDIAALGYPGIQIRSNILAQFGTRPEALRDLLARRGLTFVALSSGSVKIDPAVETAAIADHVAHAQFVRAAGGHFLQVTDERPSKERAVTPDDCARLGHLLTEIGRKSSDLGVTLGYHPHMGTIGEKPDDAARVLDAADPKYVKLLLDVAHYRQGGGDPAAAIRRYRDRLAFVHLKDVESTTTGAGYRFVELGRGNVNLDAVFTALRDVGFDGWAVVELDSVPDPSRTARDCAEINKRYLESRGFSLR